MENTMKQFFIMLQILLLFACAHDWITVPPDNHLVGVSRYVDSEQEARSKALYNATEQFAQRCGIHISVVSNYIQKHAKTNNYGYEEFTYNSDMNSIVDVKVYLIKAKKWRIEKRTKKNNTGVEWKAHVLVSVPEGLEQKIINYQKVKEKQCNVFSTNDDYLIAKGRSFDSTSEARKDAINEFDKIVNNEVERLYHIKLTHTIKHDDEMRCSDKNKSFYFIRIGKRKLEEKAKKEVIKFAKQQNYVRGIEVLKNNKKLFLKQNEECAGLLKKNNAYCKLFNHFISLKNDIKKIEQYFKDIKQYEKAQKFNEAINHFDKIFNIINKIKHSKNDKKLSYDDNKYFEDMLLYKKRIYMLKALNSLENELNNFIKIKSLINKDQFYSKFQDIVDTLFDIQTNNFNNFNNFKRTDRSNELLKKYSQQYSIILKIFKKNSQIVFSKTKDLLSHFEPIRDEDYLININKELNFFNKNFDLFNNNQDVSNDFILLNEEFKALEKEVKAYNKLNTKLKDFKYIPQGMFLMGSNKTDKDKKTIIDPLHLVKLTQPFYICDHEVTVNEYKEYCDNNSSNAIVLMDITCSQQNFFEGRDKGACDGNKKKKVYYKKINDCDMANWFIDNNTMLIKNGKDKHPMNCVSWNDAINYINWLNNEQSKHALSHDYYYHLCTEAQWEYSARGYKCKKISNWKENELRYTCDEAPNKTFINRSYICGNEKNCLSQIACYQRLCSGTCRVKDKTHNEWGIYDMNGNVAEWVQDKRYSFKKNNIGAFTKSEKMEHNDKNVIRITIDPLGEKDINSDSRIYKGGSYWSRTDNMKVSTRKLFPRTSRSTSIGIRICVSKKRE